MSVYKRPGAQTYSYDFRLGGHRFSGDTGKAEKRQAEAVEREKRAEAKAQIAEGIALDKPNTWELAASRYWLEVGQHHTNAETTLKSLDWLTRHIGKQTRLADIDDNRVAGLVARRRVEKNAAIHDPEREPQQLSAATINRSVTEPLRKVLLRAERTWLVKVGRVHWRQHMLPEPKERVREASAGEEAAILAQLERGYDDAIRFCFLSGLRRIEICRLRWTDVDFFSKQITVTGKGGKVGIVPLSRRMYDLLWALRDQHPTHVFSFIAQKTRRELQQVRGQRYPIQLDRLSHVLKDAAIAAGVANFRLHDTRHTAATRVLRQSNLKVVQQLLRHEDIATTTKYAHAVAEDVRSALDAVDAATTPTEIATPPEAANAKPMSLNGK